jgi:hypothetical protein
MLPAAWAGALKMLRQQFLTCRSFRGVFQAPVSARYFQGREAAEMPELFQESSAEQSKSKVTGASVTKSSASMTSITHPNNKMDFSVIGSLTSGLTLRSM